MDNKSEVRFLRLLRKNISDLTDEEKSFLRARRDYFKDSQLLSDYKFLTQTPKGTVKKKNAKTQKTK